MTERMPGSSDREAGTVADGGGNGLAARVRGRRELERRDGRDDGEEADGVDRERPLEAAERDDDAGQRRADHPAEVPLRRTERDGGRRAPSGARGRGGWPGSDGKPIACTHPAANTISVTTPGCAWSIAARKQRVPARIVWIVVVVSRSRLRETRSASAPPNGPTSALGTNPAAATMPAHPA